MNDMHSVLFDDSLPRLAEFILRTLGEEALKRGVALRDATGKLSFVVHEECESDATRSDLAHALSVALGPYARPDRALAFLNDPGAKQILEDPSRLPINVNGIFCQLVDRRIVGTGWLDTPKDEIAIPPRIVFSSLKGGVGRSTALVVAAADLARRNRNVLVVDLDLEAPGLGDLLLDDERMPKLGSVDYLVEAAISGTSDDVLREMIGVSSLTKGGGGRVDVVPALGRQSTLYPENVLPKLARAMIETITEEATISVGSQISSMIAQLSGHEAYDVILIDSRAGLAELTAPAMLQLGATVLLFGTAQKQTIEGYRSLLTALKLLAQRDRINGRNADWRLMFKAVYAKASFNEDAGATFRDDLYELFADGLYDEELDGEIGDDDITFSIDDRSAPHWPLVIPFNQSFIDFDPSRIPSHLTQAFYEQTFRPFLDGLDGIITSVQSEQSRG